jgi:glycosyltransferase involved in cell wall biosynthesis
MQILFIHQNLPGQFVHLIRHFSSMPGVEVWGLGEARRIAANYRRATPEFQLFGYQFNDKREKSMRRELHYTEVSVNRGLAVAKALNELRVKGLSPDLVYGHPGWGEMLYVRDVFPDARIVNYCEFYFNRIGQDFGFDTEFSETNDDGLHVRTQNMVQSVSLLSGDAAITPTLWQQSRYPEALRTGIEVIHDGIDLSDLDEDPSASISLRGENLKFSRSDEVITFVSRNLEPHRGFHVFMRALPELLRRRPNAHVVIVGGDEVSYSLPLKGRSYREHMLREVSHLFDQKRVHFVGRIPYAIYRRLLQVSTVHVYLTYPFVLSWSLLEAMASGCLVIGSRTPPVEEVIEHGKNGLLVDFFDQSNLIEEIVNVCEKRSDFDAMRQAARETVKNRYDLKTICLPRQLSVLASGLSAKSMDRFASSRRAG